MLALGPLAFATPWILLALTSLPLIWWLLRVTPPAPKRIKFPAIQLLMGLDAREESPAKMPLWLLVLRLCLAALIILALATPLWRPAPNAQGANGFLIVIDNDWSAAANWTSLTREAQALIEQAKRANQPVALLTTTGPNAQRPPQLQTAGDALAKLRALTPFALPANRATTALALEAENTLPAVAALSPVWISNGLEDWQAQSLATALVETTGKDITLIRPSPAQTPVLILPPTAGSEGLDVTARRVEGVTTAATYVVRARAENGAVLATLEMPFSAGEVEHTESLSLPLELRNRLTRLDIESMPSAGSTFLLDQRWKRRTVGIITASREKEGQPLLSDVYYLERALQPFAEILRTTPLNTEATTDGVQSEIATLLKQNLSVLILSDVGQLSQGDTDAISLWVKAGGFLVRFAGPRLAANSETLMPVTLRNGNRSLEGALSWTTPQTLAPFDEKSPFYGLSQGDDVSINRQVLANPNSLQEATTWAALNDGTPLVTGRTLGAGSLVLFHVTANTEWSNLPLSGLFVDMLSRIVDLSEGVPPSIGSEQLATLNPKSIMTGTAQLIAPPPWVEALQIGPDTTLIPDGEHPAGLYGDGGLGRALNIGALDIELSAQQHRPEFGLVKGLEPQAEQRLKAPLLVVAFILFMIDTLAALHLSGKLSGTPLAKPLAKMGRANSTTALMLLAATLVVTTPSQSRAEEKATNPISVKTLEAALKTRLAYVLTGDTQTDEVSKLGLETLSAKLHDRTAISPGKPIAIDIETDELSIYPFLYWPVLRDQQPLSDATAARVDAYMKRGGMILFDTKAQGNAISRADGRSDALVDLLEKLDIPTLTPVSDSHVLTRSFYLMQTFPGRWDNGTLWVEAARNTSLGQGSSNDGVTAILIGENDFAGAWAHDGADRPLFPVVPGGERQREWAYRFGINLVIYSMTGNYKADQVHIPALLERLGQ